SNRRTMSRGELDDTYVAALQHDMADIPQEATLVGVVRRATPWFHGAVDENIAPLGPPPDLLEEVEDRRETLLEEGLADAAAHNQAFEDVSVERRYREHLETADAARALDSLASRLESGEDLVLVCYENTAEKRCHRTILGDVLEERLSGDGG
ncbi:MAG: DUF488 family protein, partial [Halodesulfurarchaeum sp.]